MSQNILEALDNLAALSGDLEDLTAAINAAVQCCSDGPGGRAGQAVDDPAKDWSDVGIGISEQFPSQAEYLGVKCLVANLIFDQVRHTPAWLYDNLGDLLTGTFGGMTAGLVAHALLGPIGWGSFAVELTITAMAAYIVAYTISFSDIIDALDDVQDDLVATALYNAGSAEVARESFLTILATASPSLGTVETGFIRILLNNKLLNELFTPSSDTLSKSPTSDVDCGTTIQVWSFASSGESWSAVDLSDGSLNATGAWNSGAEAWRITMDMSSGAGAYMEGGITRTGLSIAVAAGNSVQFDHSGSSDGLNVFYRIYVTYSDASTGYAAGGEGSGPGTLTMAVTEAKTISTITVTGSREYDAGYNFTWDVQEVRVQ